MEHTVMVRTSLCLSVCSVCITCTHLHFNHDYTMTIYSQSSTFLTWLYYTYMILLWLYTHKALPFRVHKYIIMCITKLFSPFNKDTMPVFVTMTLSASAKSFDTSSCNLALLLKEHLRSWASRTRNRHVTKYVGHITMNTILSINCAAFTGAVIFNTCSHYSYAIVKLLVCRFSPPQECTGTPPSSNYELCSSSMHYPMTAIMGLKHSHLSINICW